MGSKKMLRQKKLIDNPQQMLFMEETVAVENLYPSGSKREEIEEKFKNTIHEELKLGSLVSYVGNKNIPFLRILQVQGSFRL
ncbi:MAG: hypothetical protein KIIPBIDF_00186 [Candidatus Methanoperedenaceae archaeon GB50]|nr:MAG: hypothetical protein KIIPBIDF_00186 [Candidatus Methanoperedenaceae archaeon GB50]